MSETAAMAGVETPWKQRFRVERILWSVLAQERPDRGLVASNPSGRYQLYAWEVPAGQLWQVTDRPEGVLFGFIDSLGRHVYYTVKAPVSTRVPSLVARRTAGLRLPGPRTGAASTGR